MVILRDGQREVARYRGGYLAVTAVPGAGKTTVLAYLAAELIAGGYTAPGKILIVTYMNSSVANFKARIARFLEERGLPARGYEVRTLHSLAMQILKERPDRVLVNEAFQVMDEGYKDRLLRQLVQNWMQTNYDAWRSRVSVPEKDGQRYSQALGAWQDKTLDFVREMISYCKSNGLTADAVQALAGQAGSGSFLPWVADIYARYQQELVRQGVIDFEDMINFALKLLLEDADLLARLRKRWTYIFEDEAQDSNPLQEQILTLLAGEQGNLVRVGDSNQAIMGTFTSAEPELFREFCRRTPVQPIRCSSRSTADIINLANRLVLWAREEHPEPACREALALQLICPAPPDDPCPNPVTAGYMIAAPCFETDREEIGRIARHAVDYAARNPEKTVAILAPASYILRQVAEVLAGWGVRFRELTGSPGERQKTTEDFAAALDYLAHPDDNNRLLKLLRRFVPDIAGEENRLLVGWLERVLPEELFYSLDKSGHRETWPPEFTNLAVWTDVSRMLERVRKWLDASFLPPDSLVLYIAEDLGLKGEEREIAGKIALDLKRFLDQHPGWRLAQVAEELQFTKNAINQFANMIFERSGYQARPGEINLVTCHKAKGLEWDMVYVIATTATEYPSTLSDKIRSELWFLPGNLANPSALAKAELRLFTRGQGTASPLAEAKRDEIGERLRLLYVAVTRARESLVVSCHRTATAFGRTKKVQPARAYEVIKAHVEAARKEREHAEN